MLNLDLVNQRVRHKGRASSIIRLARSHQIHCSLALLVVKNMRLLYSLSTLLLLRDDTVVVAAADNDGDGRRLKHHLRQQPTEGEKNLFSTASNTSSGRGSLLNLFGQSNVVGNTGEEEVVTAAAADSNSSSTPTATIANNNFKETRIINGDTVDPSTYPFYVQMTSPYICGGSLITPNIILTAQHCVEEDKTEYKWKFWDVYLKKFITYSSKNIIRHPGYNDWLENDIALVVMDSPILSAATTTDANGHQYWEPSGTYDWKNAPPMIGIQRYRSPSGCTSVTREEAYDMTTLEIIGYGVDETDKGVVDDLQMAEIHYVSNEECNDQYGSGWVTDDMMW